MKFILVVLKIRFLSIFPVLVNVVFLEWFAYY